MKGRRRIAKFKHGIDANRALSRKLLTNFILHGKITTTSKKAKSLRIQIEKLMSYAKKNDEAAKNQLLYTLSDIKSIALLREQIAPVFKEKTGGYVRLTSLSQRDSDGTLMAKVEWTLPVVLEEKKTVEKPQKETKAVEKTTAPKTKRAIKAVKKS